MADRPRPPPVNPPPSATNSNGAGAANSARRSQYAANRPAYTRPPPKPRRTRRGCCCRCFLWSTLLLVFLLFLAAIAGGVFYVIYRPRRPAFSVTALRVASLNVSASNQLTSRLNVSVTARNPNKKLVYLYGPFSVYASKSGGGFTVGEGSIPGFVQEAGNATVVRAAVGSSGMALDAAAAADLRKKGSLKVEVRMETKASVKVGGAKTKKMAMWVSCGGVEVAVPKGKPATAVAIPAGGENCKVRLRIKIWKWKWYL